MAASAGPVLSREEVDRALARLGAERDAVESALLALQDHPGLRLLDGAELSGRTLERWSVAGKGLPLLWALFDRYSEALASARAVRARKAKPGTPELAELSELLTGDAVTVPGGVVPDGPQVLGAPAKLVERISLDALMTRMNSWYATVLEVVSAADAVWSALPARIDLLLAELQRVRTLAASLGVRTGAHPLGDDLAGIEKDLTELRTEVRGDPLALWRPARVPAQRGTVPEGSAFAGPAGVVDTERFDRAGRALDGVRLELEDLLRLRDEAEDRLQGVGDLLQRADATLAEARRARGEVLAKIASSDVPAVPGPASALRERIVAALDLRQAGQWGRLAPLLDTLEDAAAKELTRARQSLSEVTQPLAVRAELRGRLDAYKAMAARLRVSEDPEVIERYEKARWLLWSAPCDLRAAAAAVARFQQSLRPAHTEAGTGQAQEAAGRPPADGEVQGGLRLMGGTCERPECSGSGRIDADGYCDECGLAPAARTTATPGGATTGTAGTGAPTTGAPGTAAPGTGAPASAGPGSPCPRDCSGTIDPDGYCDECGLTPPGGDTGVTQPYVPSARVSPGSGPTGSGHGSGGPARSMSARTGSARTMSGRSRSHRSTRTGSGRSLSVRSTRGGGTAGTRSRLGAGLVTVPTVEAADPSRAVLANPEVPERKRFCSKCEAPVGREKNGSPGRPDGFCTKCGTPYSFTPKLRRGDLVGGQYEVVGCLAHGGLGWIYLAVDRRVNDKWVVLKGLLDTGDEDALAVAVAERRFLAEVDHPNIVRIINFAEHPDLRTGATDGYIVMEYVGGKSLKDIANERRTADGRREPLPVEQAIAYALEALPALGYLHGRGLVYCDFKIDNVIQSGDTLKIIDMGAVRRLDDDGPIYGTIGYQAPEIATDGPSVASDLYTVARTLAVLTFDFQGYSGTYRDSLPGPEQVEAFARYESYYRFLVRATDPDPARRFASAEEMADQLTGVLREIMALQDDRPRPAPSTLFGPELRVVDTELVLPTEQAGQLRVAPLDPAAAALALPVPRVDPGDPNAGFLAVLVTPDPEETLAALAAAPTVSVESRLRELRTLLELGRHPDAVRRLAELEQDQPDDWRVVWYRGLTALVGSEAPPRAEERAGAESEERPEASGRVTALRAAAEAFDAVYDAFPGEAAPKLALAICAELLADGGDAAEFYRLVWATDHAYLSAAFGLARVRLAEEDRTGAVRVLETVPATSNQYTAARIAAVRARLRERPATDDLAVDLGASSAQLTALRLDSRRREELAVEVLDAALGWVGAEAAAGRRATDLVVLGRPAQERELRFALEQSYRVLARLADRAEIRIEMVERANRARPRTWV